MNGLKYNTTVIMTQVRSKKKRNYLIVVKFSFLQVLGLYLAYYVVFVKCCSVVFDFFQFLSDLFGVLGQRFLDLQQQLGL